jgi:2-dehydro-3-deoxygluconokinase
MRATRRSGFEGEPLGAGDAFSAGLLSGLLDGLPDVECLDRAIVLGAFAVASSGDWEGLPTRAELGLLGQAEGAVLR